MKRASAEVGTTTVLEKKEIKKPGIGLVNKVTPYRDLSWYIKWAGTVFLLSAICVRASELSTQVDFILSLVGTGLWLVVGLLWHDRAIIVINAAAVVLLSIGLLNSLPEGL